jgi:hypothetical protein
MLLWLMLVCSMSIVTTVTVGELNIVQKVIRVYQFNDDTSYAFVVDTVNNTRRIRYGNQLTLANFVYNFVISVSKLSASRCTIECFLYNLCVQEKRSRERCPLPLNCFC